MTIAGIQIVVPIRVSLSEKAILQALSSHNVIQGIVSGQHVVVSVDGNNLKRRWFGLVPELAGYHASASEIDLPTIGQLARLHHTCHSVQDDIFASVR